MEHKLLSKKEREVVSWICQGKSYKAVASEMQLSVNTVKTHMKHIYKKLKVKSKAELIVKTMTSDSTVQPRPF